MLFRLMEKTNFIAVFGPVFDKSMRKVGHFLDDGYNFNFNPKRKSLVFSRSAAVRRRVHQQNDSFDSMIRLSLSFALMCGLLGFHRQKKKLSGNS